MTHEKALISQQRERTEEKEEKNGDVGIIGCRVESRDLSEKRASAVLFPILTEADYALLSVLTHLGWIHKPLLVDVCVISSLKKLQPLQSRCY